MLTAMRGAAMRCSAIAALALPGVPYRLLVDPLPLALADLVAAAAAAAAGARRMVLRFTAHHSRSR
jgi:hypothetical protein